MSIIVMAETRTAYAPSMTEDYVRNGKLVAVHAAAADPSAPGDPVGETVCGKSTTNMDKIGYQPSGPSSTWYPQNLQQWMCRTCNQGLHSA